MQTVVICGRGRAAEAVVNACAENGGAIVCGRGRILATGRKPRFLLIGSGELKSDVPPGSIVVLEDGESIGKDSLDGSIAVIDSSDRLSRISAARSGAVTVGCSVSGKDTITVSGQEGDEVLVSLRRSLSMPDGEKLEPCEFSVRADEKYRGYPILAASAVLLLSGEKGEDGIGF